MRSPWPRRRTPRLCAGAERPRRRRTARGSANRVQGHRRRSRPAGHVRPDSGRHRLDPRHERSAGRLAPLRSGPRIPMPGGTPPPRFGRGRNRPDQPGPLRFFSKAVRALEAGASGLVVIDNREVSPTRFRSSCRSRADDHRSRRRRSRAYLATRGPRSSSRRPRMDGGRHGTEQRRHRRTSRPQGQRLSAIR